MKKLLFYCLLFISANSHAQTLIGDSIYISKDSILFKRGQSILCGEGMMPDGRFKFIYASPYISPQKINIGSSYSGLKLRIKKIERKGNERFGYKIIFIVDGGNISDYWVEIDDALKTGEIEKP